MYRPRLWFSILIVTYFTISLSLYGADKLPNFKIYVEDWSPYQFIENGKAKGKSVDLFLEILKRAGSSQSTSDINFVPWARGYHQTLTQKSTVLFATTRTPNREKLFKWVCTISESPTYLIAMKKRNIKITSISDIKKLRIGTVREDAGEQHLQVLGISEKNFFRANNQQKLIRMLAMQRVDAIVSGWSGFQSDSKQVGINPDLFVKVYTVATSKLCYAFNINTSPKVIHRLQQTLDGIKADGTYQKIIQRYNNKASK